MDNSLFNYITPKPLSVLKRIQLFFCKTHISIDKEGEVQTKVYAKMLKGNLYIMKVETKIGNVTHIEKL